MYAQMARTVLDRAISREEMGQLDHPRSHPGAQGDRLAMGFDP